ncbi:hypothetical protein HDV03_001303 [Kappamyces sp. JEL0829]|nr:hypothetical protein HDV03_001303 [Kappamyces sp. JEL0829]
MSTVHGGVSHGQSGGAGKVLVAIKKCKSLEYKPLKHEKAHSSRELSNVWDLLERRPECAAKMRSDAAALALPKTAKGKSKAVSSGAVAKHDKNPGVTLQNGQAALKHIAKRKEQLESILQHLNGSLSATTKPAAARKDKKPKSKKPKTKPPIVLSPYRDSSADVQDSKETLVRESTVDFRSGGYLPFQAFSDAKRSAELDLATMQDAKPVENFQELFSKPPAPSPLPPPVELGSARQVAYPDLQSLRLSDARVATPIVPDSREHTARIGTIESSGPPKCQSINNLLQCFAKEELLQGFQPADTAKVESNRPPTRGSRDEILPNPAIERFAQNLARSPQLIHNFFASFPGDGDGGLSSDEQGQVIHYGIKLEAKILEMIEQYNGFIYDLGTNLLHQSNCCRGRH